MKNILLIPSRHSVSPSLCTLELGAALTERAELCCMNIEYIVMVKGFCLMAPWACVSSLTAYIDEWTPHRLTPSSDVAICVPVGQWEHNNVVVDFSRLHFLSFRLLVFCTHYNCMIIPHLLLHINQIKPQLLALSHAKSIEGLSSQLARL